MNCQSLPLVPLALEQLKEAKYFFKLDLRSAYDLIRIEAGDEVLRDFLNKFVIPYLDDILMYSSDPVMCNIYVLCFKDSYNTNYMSKLRNVNFVKKASPFWDITLTLQEYRWM